MGRAAISASGVCPPRGNLSGQASQDGISTIVTLERSRLRNRPGPVCSNEGNQAVVPGKIRGAAHSRDVTRLTETASNSPAGDQLYTCSASVPTKGRLRYLSS